MHEVITDRDLANSDLKALKKRISKCILSDSKTPGGAMTSGAYALAEILSQPKTWDACFEFMAQEKIGSKNLRNDFRKRKWIFVGCGSSYYLRCAAASMTSLTDRRARAIPASEVLLYPELALGEMKDTLPVLISRSGRTSEVLRAAQIFKERGIETLAITCSTGQPLEEHGGQTLVLSPADEQSLVMTRSFTSMLLAMQALAATIGGDKSFSMRSSRCRMRRSGRCTMFRSECESS